MVMGVRRVCDHCALFLLCLALCWTNQPFLNGKLYRSYESTNWPRKCDSRMNILPPRRDFFYRPSHSHSTHKAAAILLHNISNYSNKDVLYTMNITDCWMNSYAVSDSFLHRNSSKRHRMKRHKRPCLSIPTAPPLSTWN